MDISLTDDLHADSLIGMSIDEEDKSHVENVEKSVNY